MSSEKREQLTNVETGAKAAMPRYERVRCEHCGDTFQLLDFYGNPHVFFCAEPRPIWVGAGFARGGAL